MQGKATMEKPDHTPDVSKYQKPKAGLQPWVVGAASCGVVLLCAGAWCLWHQAQEEARILQSHSAWPKPKVSKPTAFQPPVTESDTLEDALSKLEGNEPERPRPRKDKPKSKAAVKEKEETSEEDKEKAKDVIRETLKKLEAEGKQGKKGSKTRKTIEKLKALLGEEEEEQEPEEITEEQQSHLDFAKALQEEQKRKIHVDMKTVRNEFKRDFGSDSRSLLCSGCKMVAGRLSSELDTHDVHEQESPAQMLAAKRKAIDSTCSSLRHLQAVKDDESGSARFEASEVTGEGEREGKRLCAAILEESRFDILARLIQRKIPEMQQFQGEKHHPNWERWLCAERMRLCKRSEVRHDEDDEIDQDL